MKTVQLFVAKHYRIFDKQNKIGYNVFGERNGFSVNWEICVDVSTSVHFYAWG